jgi:hypothetical protein
LERMRLSAVKPQGLRRRPYWTYLYSVPHSYIWFLVLHMRPKSAGGRLDEARDLYHQQLNLVQDPAASPDARMRSVAHHRPLGESGLATCPKGSRFSA